MDDPTALLTSFDDGVDGSAHRPHSQHIPLVFSLSPPDARAEKTARSVPSRSKTVAVIECSPQLGLVEMARRTYNVLITQHRAACGEEDCPHSWVDTEVVARKSVGEACQTYDFVAGPGYMRGTLLATYSMKKPCSSCGVNLIFKLSGGSEVVEGLRCVLLVLVLRGGALRARLPVPPKPCQSITHVVFLCFRRCGLFAPPPCPQWMARRSSALTMVRPGAQFPCYFLYTTLPRRLHRAAVRRGVLQPAEGIPRLRA